MQKQFELLLRNAACDVVSLRGPAAETLTRLFDPISCLARDRPHPFRPTQAWTRCGSAKELLGGPILSLILIDYRRTVSARVDAWAKSKHAEYYRKGQLCGAIKAPV